MSSEFSVVADDVDLGDGIALDPFCVLGVDPDDQVPPLVVGERARIRSHSVLYRGTTIGAGFHCGHGVLIREHTSIGDDVSIGSHSVVEHHVRLGRGVRVHSRCFIPELSILDDGAWLGPGVVVTNARFPNRPDTKEKLEGVHVREGAVIGAGAVLLPGVTIGAGALIGAGAVVVRDVPPARTVIGNPGRVR